MVHRPPIAFVVCESARGSAIANSALKVSARLLRAMSLHAWLHAGLMRRQLRARRYRRNRSLDRGLLDVTQPRLRRGADVGISGQLVLQPAILVLKLSKSVFQSSQLVLVPPVLASTIGRELRFDALAKVAKIARSGRLVLQRWFRRARMGVSGPSLLV